MIKLIISDIDGTILNNNHEFSEYLLKTINAARQKGVLFTLATGRMYASAIQIAKGLSVDLPIICYNGCYIRDVVSDKIYLNEGISPEDTIKIIKTCREHGTHVQYYLNDKLCCPQDTEYMIEYTNITKVPYYALGEEFYNVKEPVSKILIADKNINNKNELHNKLLKLNANVDFTSSHKFYLEIMPKYHSKATALKILAKQLNVDIGNIMTAGDAFNDLEMLKLVGTGVAMGQAPDEVKSIANYVTDTNENDGLAKAIETLVLNA